jgi:hypothetical protein
MPRGLRNAESWRRLQNAKQADLKDGLVELAGLLDDTFEIMAEVLGRRPDGGKLSAARAQCAALLEFMGGGGELPAGPLPDATQCDPETTTPAAPNSDRLRQSAVTAIDQAIAMLGAARAVSEEAIALLDDDRASAARELLAQTIDDWPTLESIENP